MHTWHKEELQSSYHLSGGLQQPRLLFHLQYIWDFPPVQKRVNNTFVWVSLEKETHIDSEYEYPKKKKFLSLWTVLQWCVTLIIMPKVKTRESSYIRPCYISEQVKLSSKNGRIQTQLYVPNAFQVVTLESREKEWQIIVTLKLNWTKYNQNLSYFSTNVKM